MFGGLFGEQIPHASFDIQRHCFDSCSRLPILIAFFCTSELSSAIASNVLEHCQCIEGCEVLHPAVSLQPFALHDIACSLLAKFTLNADCQSGERETVDERALFNGRKIM